MRMCHVSVRLRTDADERQSLSDRPFRYVMTLALAYIALVPGLSLARERPNIVLILADDVGQECLGCYGGESYATPHLDRLAARGMQFEHCYSMPVCHPTRITLLTGRYPFRFPDASWGSFPNAAESMTVARLLAQSGYATGVFGKWQLALLREEPSHAQRLGFQYSDLFGWHEGPRYYEPMIYRNGRVRDDTLGHYGPDLYVHGLIEFMKRHRGGPFFAFYSMALCHDVTDDLGEPVPHGPMGRYDSYPEMVSEMDRAVGRVIGALEALGIEDNTLVLFVADNGTPRRMILEALQGELRRVPVVSRQHGRNVRGGKGTLFDAGTRVPLIAYWPAKIAAGTVVPDLVDMSDFWPTLLELASVESPAEVETDGVSFAQRLTKNQASPRTFAYSESNNQSYWMRDDRYKLYSDGRFVEVQASAWKETELKPSGEAESIFERLKQAMDKVRPSQVTQASSNNVTDDLGR